MLKLDPETGEPLLTEDGQPIYEGYCIDLIEKLSEVNIDCDEAIQYILTRNVRLA